MERWQEDGGAGGDIGDQVAQNTARLDAMVEHLAVTIPMVQATRMSEHLGAGGESGTRTSGAE